MAEGGYWKKNDEIVYITGKISWCSHIQLTRWNKWSVTIHPDQVSLQKINDLKDRGLKNELKKDDDGYFIQFHRNPTREIRGRTVAQTPPDILDPNGTRYIDQRLIGNGSDATIKLVVYPHKTPSGGQAVAARWEGMKIHNLIPYDPHRDETEEDKKKLDDLNKQEPTW